jgi:chromate transporter
MNDAQGDRVQPRDQVAMSGSAMEVLLVFLRLGCTSFGGPVAHLGYFQREIVERRKWCGESTLAELIALAQSLPGPASSQVGFALGILRAGWLGGLAAWTGFTLPSAVLMLAFAYGHSLISSPAGASLLHALQLVAVAVVAQAVLAMQRSLAPDRRRMVFAIIAVAVVLFGPPAFATLVAIAAGVGCGLLFLRSEQIAQDQPLAQRLPKRVGVAAAACFLILLVLPPIVSLSFPNQELQVFSAFYRTGALVFGGGHVVLPLLEHSVVARGWVTQPAFLAGYGAAQALPGPLFTFGAYLGAVVRPSPSPLTYGLIGLVGIFTPGLLAMAAVLPFWSSLRRNMMFQAAIRGINAAVVGVLMAALYHPLWTTTIHSPIDFWVALVAFALLTLWKAPSWSVVVGTAALYMLTTVL